MSAARMSVVVVTDRFRTIRRVLDRLREQTARDRLEVVIVLPQGPREGDDELSLQGFAGVRVHEIPSIHPVPAARAAGIRVTSAPIVFLGETHSFPHPGLAAALIDAHDSDWDVVVPGLANANPENALSWASFLMDYGVWLDSLPAGPISGGPTWNAAYKRAVLDEAGDRLETAMEHGDVLSEWLRSRGRRAYFQPHARVDHANISQAGSWIEQRYLSGLLVANARRKRWSLQRRMLYAAASPLVPAVIMYRLRRPVKNLLGRRGMPLATLPVLLLGTIVRTAGEVVGYTFGARPAAQPRMDEFEIHKLRFTSMPV